MGETRKYRGSNNEVLDGVGVMALQDTVQLAGTPAPAIGGTATGDTLAATTGSTPKTGVRGGSYLWDVQFTGTSVVLQSLGADGNTWRDVATRTSTGTTGVVIGNNATVRVYNPNATPVTALFSSLS